MTATSVSISDYLHDVIIDIRKVNEMSSPDAEIFMELRDHGKYSIDPHVYRDFEAFWLNAEVSNDVLVLEDSSGQVVSIKLGFAQ